MAWRAVHPLITEDRKIPADSPDAPTFTLGFWPPLEAERAKVHVSGLRRVVPEESSTDHELQRVNHDLQAFWAMARFGVRTWSGLGDLLCTTEKVVVDGREHVALTDESLRILYHSGLLLPVAIECWKYNTLTDEEKKTSNSPSNFSASETAMFANGATGAWPPARS